MGAPYIYDVSRLRVKEKKGYCKLKEEALYCPLRRTRIGKGYGSVNRQTKE